MSALVVEKLCSKLVENAGCEHQLIVALECGELELPFPSGGIDEPDVVIELPVARNASASLGSEKAFTMPSLLTPFSYAFGCLLDFFKGEALGIDFPTRGRQ